MAASPRPPMCCTWASRLSVCRRVSRWASPSSRLRRLAQQRLGARRVLAQAGGVGQPAQKERAQRRRERIAFGLGQRGGVGERGVGIAEPAAREARVGEREMAAQAQLGRSGGEAGAGDRRFRRQRRLERALAHLRALGAPDEGLDRRRLVARARRDLRQRVDRRLHRGDVVEQARQLDALARHVAPVGERGRVRRGGVELVERLAPGVEAARRRGGGDPPRHRRRAEPGALEVGGDAHRRAASVDEGVGEAVVDQAPPLLGELAGDARRGRARG